MEEKKKYILRNLSLVRAVTRKEVLEKKRAEPVEEKGESYLRVKVLLEWYNRLELVKIVRDHEPVLKVFVRIVEGKNESKNVKK